MVRRLGVLGLGATLLAGTAAAQGTSASARSLAANQFGARAPSTGIARTAPGTPVLLRADQPDRNLLNPDPTTGDPSIVHGYAAGQNVGGMNLSGVARLSIAADGGGFTCTGALIGPYTLATAAHCVTDNATGQLVTTNTGVTARFYGPGGFVDWQSSLVRVSPYWQGFSNPNTLAGDDLALIHFNTPALPWMTQYGIYQGDPFFAQAMEVGYGTYGNGAQGLAGFDGRRRWGQNRVDLLTLDGILWRDFDNGTVQNDAWCWADLYAANSPLCDTGNRGAESALGPGDSGGPLFINGQLAGVASFATYFCDPSNQQQCAPAVPPLADADAPWGYGALNGHAWIPYNQEFVDMQLRSIPEPSTVLLVAGGLLGMAGVARRRRQG
jgi:hypothetical protein